MDPFSHIKVVHRPREEEPQDDDAGSSPQTVFRTPSFSQQVQRAVLTGQQPVRGGDVVPAARASLATLTSGTTFAAAARQAELNAARASKLKAKEAEKAHVVPAIEPVALGTLKFRTSRHGYVGFLFLSRISFHQFFCGLDLGWNQTKACRGRD